MAELLQRFDSLYMALDYQYMGKQQKQEKAVRRASTRSIKKKKLNSDEEEFYEDSEPKPQSPNSNQESDSQYSDDDGSNQEQEQSGETPVIAPENLAVRNMQFRERRGTKMNYLISRKKEQQEDPFWAEQGQNYFGNLDQGDNDEEDYVQSSSGRDEFDSDFDQTESEHDDEEPAEEKEVDEDHEKNKKKRQQLMRKIQAPAPVIKKTAQRTTVSSSAIKKERPESEKKIGVPQTTSRYIHELFNQQELLGQAATTQYFNWLSLKKLISIETEKKDFTRRSHHIEGPKVIYRNKINTEGRQEVTYQLNEIEVKDISDLSKIMRQN